MKYISVINNRSPRSKRTPRNEDVTVVAPFIIPIFSFSFRISLNRIVTFTWDENASDGRTRYNVEKMKVAFTRARKDWSMRQEATGRVPSVSLLARGGCNLGCIRLIKTKSSRQGNKLDTSTRHGTPNISSRPLPPVINKKERNSPLRSPTADLYSYRSSACPRNCWILQ